MNTEEIKQEMIRHIRSYNKLLTKEHLNNLEIDVLINNVHPLYREYYEKQLKEEENEK